MTNEQKAAAISVNGKRLINNIHELGKIGMNQEGGIDRALGSKADGVAREWLLSYWENSFGIEPRIDPIANLWLEQPGSERLKPIVMGSHHDAVPCGGKYDGALGVLMATEIMETLKDAGVVLRHPLSLISFTGEEPNPFNVSTLGSKVAAGLMGRESLEKFFHRDTGRSLKEAVRILGGDLDRLEEAVIKPGDLAAFMECHIEQGNRLEKKGLSSSTVSCITGIYREKILLSGEANHAGTTAMDSRKDAFLAGAELSLGIEGIIKDLEDSAVAGTVGYVSVAPNEANIIPDTVTLIMDLRISEDGQKKEVIEAITGLSRRIEAVRGVSVQREVILDQPARPMSPAIMKAFDTGIEGTGEQPLHLVSMAGHDAANMALVTEAGMIFVKSVDGKSHCKEEYSTPEDIEKCANAMLTALLTLDKELD